MLQKPTAVPLSKARQWQGALCATTLGREASLRRDWSRAGAEGWKGPAFSRGEGEEEEWTERQVACSLALPPLTCAPRSGVADKGGYSRGAIWRIWFTFLAFIYSLCFKKPGDLSFFFLLKFQSTVISLMKGGFWQVIPPIIFLRGTKRKVRIIP